jgi:uncharacterized protein
MGGMRTTFHQPHRALLLCRRMPTKSKSAVRRVKRKVKTRDEIHREQDLFARGVLLFNAKYFFEAHEAWEELWLRTAPPEKTFLQGLIQVTAAFHHHSRNNLRGMKSLLRAGLAKLEPFPGNHRGMNISELRERGRNWLKAFDDSAIARKLKHPRLKRSHDEP